MMVEVVMAMVFTSLSFLPGSAFQFGIGGVISTGSIPIGPSLPSMLRSRMLVPFYPGGVLIVPTGAS
jgi:hypothetical protein